MRALAWAVPALLVLAGSCEQPRASAATPRAQTGTPARDADRKIVPWKAARADLPKRPTPPEVVPALVPYELEPDLSNVENLHEFVFTEEQKEFIARDHMLIYDSGLGNPVGAYLKTPVPFVTSDIILHAYHVLLSDSVEKVEKLTLRPALETFIREAMAEVTKARERCTDDARPGARKALVLLSVAAELLGLDVAVLADVQEDVAGITKGIEECRRIEFDGREIDGSLLGPRAAYEPEPEW
ncbi:MAG: DUF3160 domain-containing protein, partial [Planctomycetota bacterium]